MGHPNLKIRKQNLINALETSYDGCCYFSFKGRFELEIFSLIPILRYCYLNVCIKINILFFYGE